MATPVPCRLGLKKSRDRIRANEEVAAPDGSKSHRSAFIHIDARGIDVQWRFEE
jgi:hypothetical protein